MARLIGASAADVALILSVSSTAGLVAAQFGPAEAGRNVVIGEREYCSNHFPWRRLARLGYDVRQVPFRNGGIEPEDVARLVDSGTGLVAFSGVQTATGHRSDIAAISGIARQVGAIVFVDGSQLVGALNVADDLPAVDVLVVPDHKFLLHAGRGMGYCYLAPSVQRTFAPINAGWRAGAVPFESFFGPQMNLSPTASRFDTSISWLAATGNRAALADFDHYGGDVIFARNRELTGTLRAALADIGWPPIALPEKNLSTIVSLPLNRLPPWSRRRDLGVAWGVNATRAVVSARGLSVSSGQLGVCSQGSLRSKKTGSPMLSAFICSIISCISGGGSFRSPSRAASSEVK